MKLKIIIVLFVLVLIFSLNGVEGESGSEGDVVWLIDVNQNRMIEEIDGKVICPHRFMLFTTYEPIDIVYRDIDNSSMVHYQQNGTRRSTHNIRFRTNSELIIKHEGEEVYNVLTVEDSLRNTLVMRYGLTTNTMMWTIIYSFSVSIFYQFWKNYNKEDRLI